jgi:hypothetical protein
MDPVSRDQKLRLTAQIRSRYSRMQADLSDREHILYGKISGRNILSPEAADENDAPAVHSTLKLRFLIAVLLVLSFVLLDQKQYSLAGITAEDIGQAISIDYEAAAEEWIETMTRQLSD